MRSLAYYITSHGYGHAARSCDILRAIGEEAPGLPITVVSTVPQSFLAARLGQLPWTYRPASFDLGMRQIDSIRMDIPGSLANLQELYRHRDTRLEAEARWLDHTGVDRVVCDLPTIPLGAAERAGVPSIAVGNFSWDWIYEPFIRLDPAWSGIVEQVRADAAHAARLIRLPFAEPMASFRHPIDVPLVARPGTPSRDRLVRAYGCDPGQRWALLSFTSLDWNEAALARVAAIRDTVFFTMEPLRWPLPNAIALPRTFISFADLVASVDVVVTKPGYGILSECVVNQKPILYAERTDFREYEVLVAAIQRHVVHRHLPADLLYRGEIDAALRSIDAARPAREPLHSDGGRAAARAILGSLNP